MANTTWRPISASWRSALASGCRCSSSTAVFSQRSCRRRQTHAAHRRGPPGPRTSRGHSSYKTNHAFSPSSRCPGASHRPPPSRKAACPNSAAKSCNAVTEGTFTTPALPARRPEPLRGLGPGSRASSCELLRATVRTSQNWPTKRFRSREVSSRAPRRGRRRVQLSPSGRAVATHGPILYRASLCEGPAGRMGERRGIVTRV